MTNGIGSLGDLAATDAAQWWYLKDGQSQGPITDAALRKLAASAELAIDDLVWREGYGEEWKTLGDAGLVAAPPAPPILPTRSKEAPSEPIRPYNPKWQKVFDAAAAEQTSWSLVNRTGTRQSFRSRSRSGWILQSIPGFVFGPFYYFYLRMWRKGLLIMGFLPVIILIEQIAGSLRVLDLLIPALCATMVKRDYYKYCIKGETVWPFLRFSKSIYADIGIVLGITVICAGVGIALGETPTGSSHVAESSATDTVSVVKKPDLNPSNFEPTGFYMLTITGRANSIRVDNISVNRGACRLVRPFIPETLRFGETAEAMTYCNPLEVKVETSSGEVDFSWPK